MKSHSFLTLVAAALLTPMSLAQRVEPKNSLGRARSTYDASDADKNGKVTIEEFARQRVSIQRADFDAMDADKDGAWSRDEFLVYYRRLLINSGERSADDLEAEVARIQAARRAKAAQSAPRRPAPAPDASERLRIAIDDLEKKVALRQATREDFKSVRDGMIERARQSTPQDPAAGNDLAAKFEVAVNALEIKAREGNYRREDYTALREMLITRAREAAKPIPATGQANAPLTEQQLEAALDAALDDLANKAEARSATRDDYTRVKNAYIARARAAAPNLDPNLAAERVTLEQRFISAIDKLENDAREGRFTRAEFQTMREAYVSRVRAIASPNAAPATPEVPAASTPVAAIDLATRLDSALDELAKKAEARQATRADFGRVRDAMTARARALASSNPAAAGAIATLDEAFAKAIEKLEADAREGKFSREEFQAIREGYVSRARAIAGSLAAPATPEAPAVRQPAAPADPATQLDAALDELAKKAEARQATREDFGRVRDAMTARARALASANPAAAGQIATIDELFAKAMEKLEADALAGKFSREEFQTIRDSYVSRARAIVGSGAPVAQPVPPPVSTPMPAPNTDSIEKRFDDALNQLEHKAVARGATRADFQSVSDLLVARARATVQTQTGTPVSEGDPRITTLTASLQGALARLESAYSAGELNTADFANLRQLLIARVRDVNNPPAPEQKPTDPPSRTRPAPEQPKPADPPKDERTGRPVTPPHRDG